MISLLVTSFLVMCGMVRLRNIESDVVMSSTSSLFVFFVHEDVVKDVVVCKPMTDDCLLRRKQVWSSNLNKLLRTILTCTTIAVYVP